MREGELKKPLGCLKLIVLSYLLSIPVMIFVFAWFEFQYGQKTAGITFVLFALLFSFGLYGGWKYLKKRKQKGKEKNIKPTPDSIELQTTNGKIQFNNPFRGFFIVGAAGSGKSESGAVPMLGQFISKNFAGIVYDFKYPALANDVQAYIDANKGVLRHYFLNFNDPYQSHRVNPINPRYLINTSYAREYAQAIISNLMKESIKKPDFWSRSATDLLTACIWYLKEERPDICDLPHVCAMITSNDTALLSKLQENPTTAQMTISIYNAMQRGAEGQTAGVVGTLQGAIAQINTPELMYIFGGDDFSLDINNPEHPAVVTVGNYPTLANTLAPLCALVITVATKLMNQPDKNKSFVLLDEAPTCYIPNLEVLPNTGRSNKIATVIMCQDLAQLTDSYGQEKADVLFASCNNHLYGRVASSRTSEVLSRQFGKVDKTYIVQSKSRTPRFLGSTAGQSETVQERDIIRPAEFLSFEVGEFAGIAVESSTQLFRKRLLRAERPQFNGLKKVSNQADIYGYYNQVRHDINNLFGASTVAHENGSKTGTRNNDFNIFGQ